MTTQHESGPDQLNLFQTPEELAAEDMRQRQIEWATHFERSPWTQPWEGATGTPAGSVLDGVRCPACGKVEPSDFVLAINHGLDPDRPGSRFSVVQLDRCLLML